MSQSWWVWVAAGMILAGVLLVLRPRRRASREARLAQVRRDFHAQRERLEAKFVQLAAARSKSRTAHWEDCEFDDDVAYVRNRKSGEISAFVGVTVAVRNPDEPLSGPGDLIGNLQAGTAVFRLDRDHWETDGRAILNLSPSEAICFYQDDFEMVDQEWASRR